MGFLSSDPFTDPRLGTFTRKGSRWLGSLQLAPHGSVELRVAGDRKAPDPAALAAAARVADEYTALKEAIAAALFEHYEPYRDAADDEGDEGGVPVPAIANAAGTWAHIRSAVVDVDVSRREFPVEVRLEVAWDMEHTLGARMKDGALVELCGSTGP
ncbi:MAG: hypothetical protein OEW77_03390 [Gemmatimonadota bacterium]|nr:hypothetical protein [Gemmatimonadota bacterium]